MLFQRLGLYKKEEEEDDDAPGGLDEAQELYIADWPQQALLTLAAAQHYAKLTRLFFLVRYTLKRLIRLTFELSLQHSVLGYVHRQQGCVSQPLNGCRGGCCCVLSAR